VVYARYLARDEGVGTRVWATSVDADLAGQITSSVWISFYARFNTAKA
jgi:hypothetical protein